MRYETWAQRLRALFTTPMWRSRDDVTRSAWTVLYVVIGFYIVGLGNALSDRINTSVDGTADPRAPIKDFIIDNFHPTFLRTTLPKNLADILVGISIGLLILRLFTLKRWSFTVSRRVLFILTTLFLFRATQILSTVLPNPLNTCEFVPHPWGVFWEALLIMAQLRTSCGDVFFSGHTVFFTLTVLAYFSYVAPSDEKPGARRRVLAVWVVRALVALLWLWGSLALAFTSYHYTIDISSAVFFTGFFWHYYHLCITVPSLRRRWIGRFFGWIDGTNCDPNDPSVTTFSMKPRRLRRPSAGESGSGSATSMEEASVPRTLLRH